MNWKLGALIRQVGITALLTVAAFAQFPDKYKNLQYYPKSVSKQDLQNAMRNFSLSLGGDCETCHVATPDHHLDFASDDKQEKLTARQMLKMVDQINHGYIATLGTSASPVECVTCHRGIQKPVTINRVLLEAIEKKSVEAAIAQYTDLRKKYYGSASYDFSELPLDMVAESLVQKDQAKDALAIMDMNLSFNTPTARTYNVLAMVHRANGESEKAKADLGRLLELQPENRRAKQMLEELKSGKR
jgi:hypothetical protein